MIKSFAAIAAALALLAGAAVFEHCHVTRSLHDFYEEVHVLYEKAEAGTANVGDAEAVRTAWEARKQTLHIWLPHGDVNRMDEPLSEAVRLIAEGEPRFAVAKLEIVMHAAKTLPAGYRLSLANLF